MAMLELVKSTCETAPHLPWNARSLANNGHMFSMGDAIRCFTLFSSSEDHQDQPTKHIMLEPNTISPADELMPMITSVEPWSGAIAIGMPKMLKILHFDGGDEDEEDLEVRASSYSRLD
jgi:hypothetical protein